MSLRQSPNLSVSHNMLHHAWPFSIFICRLIRHKYWVFLECAKRGLIWQGLIHDLDKWMPTALFAYYVSYYCRHFRLDLRKHPRFLKWRMAKLRHQQRQKHHSQNWIYISSSEIQPIEMPEKYAVEMVCDWIAINRTIEETRKWYDANKTMPLHKSTRLLVEKLLS